MEDAFFAASSEESLRVAATFVFMLSPAASSRFPSFHNQITQNSTLCYQLMWPTSDSYLSSVFCSAIIAKSCPSLKVQLLYHPFSTHLFLLEQFLVCLLTLSYYFSSCFIMLPVVDEQVPFRGNICTCISHLTVLFLSWTTFHPSLSITLPLAEERLNKAEAQTENRCKTKERAC